MKISIDFLEGLAKSKLMKVLKIPRGHYTYEYAMLHYQEGTVFGSLELEHDIISDVDGKVIGHFGIEYTHNLLVYNLKI